MANPAWLGGASSVAQVVHLTPGGTIEVGDKFIVTLTDKDGYYTGVQGATQSETYSAGGTTVASVCTGLAAALAASTQSMFAAVTWADATTYVTGTSETAGIPFYVSVSTTESDNSSADSQTFATSTTTSNAGPNDFNTAANWTTASVPTGSDNG